MSSLVGEELTPILALLELGLGDMRLRGPIDRIEGDYPWIMRLQPHFPAWEVLGYQEDVKVS